MSHAFQALKSPWGGGWRGMGNGLGGPSRRPPTCLLAWAMATAGTHRRSLWRESRPYSSGSPNPPEPVGTSPKSLVSLGFRDASWQRAKPGGDVGGLQRTDVIRPAGDTGGVWNQDVEMGRSKPCTTTAHGPETAERTPERAGGRKG